MYIYGPDNRLEQFPLTANPPRIIYTVTLGDQFLLLIAGIIQLLPNCNIDLSKYTLNHQYLKRTKK